MRRHLATPPSAVRAIAVLAALTAAAAGLRRVRAPIRCLNSDKWPTNVEGNRRYTERFDAVIIPGVGHFPMLEVSATFDRLLEEAVRDLVPAR